MSHEARFRVAAAVTILFLAGLVAAGLASRGARPDPAAATPRTERTTTHSSRPVRTQRTQIVYVHGRGRGGDEFESEEHDD